MKKMKRILLCFIVIFNFSRTMFGQFALERVIVPRKIPTAVDFRAIAVSQFGDIYLLEMKGNEIYRMNSDGTVLTTNGGYGWGEGQFDTPLDISMSSGLDLIVADYNNHRIVRFDRKLNYITSYPDPNSAYELSFPKSVILTNYGEIFILKDEDSEIIRLNVSQKDITAFAGLEYGNYALIDPLIIRMTEKGLISVLEKSGRILQFDRYGTPIGQLKLTTQSPILGMTPIGKDFCVVVNSSPCLYYYSDSNKSWTPIEISGMDDKTCFVASCFRNDKLYLLKRSGRIAVCIKIQTTIDH